MHTVAVPASPVVSSRGSWWLAAAVWIVVAAVGVALGLASLDQLPRVPLRPDSELTVELFGSREVSQTLPLRAAGFTAIEFRAAPAGDRPRGRVVLSLSTLRFDGQERLVYFARVPVEEVLATPSYRFVFPPRSDSNGQMYRIRIAMPEARPGQGIALWTTGGRSTDGGSLFHGEEEAFAELVLESFVARPTLLARLAHRYRTRPPGAPYGPILLLAFVVANVAFMGVCRALLAGYPGSAACRGRIPPALAFVLLCGGFGAPTVLAQGQTAARLEARAERVADGTIRVDGTLDEAVWQSAPPVTDFVQAEPDEGEPPTDQMEVRFAYDDSALYVGARMFSSAPVQTPLSRRDDGGQAESIQIELDTYLDRRTAYMFGVTAAGVRLDHYHSRDAEETRDLEYNPVWQARTVMTDDGWTAELWLPFSQLRFNARSEQVFGLNITRDVPALNEENVWALVGRTESGWASRFGDLRGIQGVEQQLRLELLPYVSGSARVTGDRDLNDPFDDGRNLGGRSGADVKYGVGTNLTLDVAFNPDFGQIEADPAEVNLTVFETIFSERRPFFLEGSDVLTAGTGNYYYSRRIGARPTGAAVGDYVDRPDTATILASAKLTGRLSSRTSLGLLAAVTDAESARTSTGGVRDRTQVAPRSGWGVARVIQEVGDQGSTVGGHLTMVHRGMAPDDPLAAVLSRNAVTAGADTRIRFADQGYEAAFNVGFTHIDGEPDAITGFQLRNSHLFQRVDLPVPLLDPTRGSLDGGQVTGRINKLSGRHWIWNASFMIESPEFEPSDFGRLNFAGDYSWRAQLNYRETVPGGLLRAYSVGPNVTHYSYYDRTLGNRYNVGVNASATFLNFWSTQVSLTRYLRGFDAQLTRGGPVMGVPTGWGASWSLRNRAGSQTQWRGQANYQSNEIGDYTWRIGATLSGRPSPSLELSVQPDYRNERGTRATFSGPINRQYLTTLPGGRAQTFGNRYVFGFPDRTTLSTQFRVSYTFRPDMTLDVYAEPFAASGRYLAFGETLVPGALHLLVYGQGGTSIERLEDDSYLVTDGAETFPLANRDFNIRSFRSNVVLRWEWRPGSTLFVVWQQNRESRETQGAHVGFGDLFESLTASGDNIFAIKTTLWTSR